MGAEVWNRDLWSMYGTGTTIKNESQYSTYGSGEKTAPLAKLESQGVYWSVCLSVWNGSRSCLEQRLVVYV